MKQCNVCGNILQDQDITCDKCGATQQNYNSYGNYPNMMANQNMMLGSQYSNTQTEYTYHKDVYVPKVNGWSLAAAIVLFLSLFQDAVLGYKFTDFADYLSKRDHVLSAWIAVFLPLLILILSFALLEDAFKHNVGWKNHFLVIITILIVIVYISMNEYSFVVDYFDNGSLFLFVGIILGFAGNKTTNRIREAKKQAAIVYRSTGNNSKGLMTSDGTYPMPELGTWECPVCGNQNTSAICSGCGQPRKK